MKGGGNMYDPLAVQMTARGDDDICDPLEVHMSARCDNDIDGHLAVQMGASCDSSICKYTQEINLIVVVSRNLNGYKGGGYPVPLSGVAPMISTGEGGERPVVQRSSS